MKTEVNLNQKIMPNAKLLEGSAYAYQVPPTPEDAMHAGEQAYKEGKELADCPKKFKPRPGDSTLFDGFVTGFKGAAIADGGGAD